MHTFLIILYPYCYILHDVLDTLKQKQTGIKMMLVHGNATKELATCVLLSLS